jgi:hypothetical protein
MRRGVRKVARHGRVGTGVSSRVIARRVAPKQSIHEASLDCFPKHVIGPDEAGPGGSQ